MKILHNPRCRKSRETLQLIEDAGVTPEVVLYLETPPSRAELVEIAGMLGMRPIEFTRVKEAEFKDLGIDKKTATDDEILDALAAHPKLIERPIVIKGATAVLGRPPENVKELL